MTFLPRAKSEEEFISLVDCCFPYNDETQWKELINLARAISPNAAFMTLEEICRPPLDASVTPALLRQMVAYWLSEFDHPLADIIANCALILIEGRELPVEEARAPMREISFHKGQYCALNIVYFGCEEGGRRR